MLNHKDLQYQLSWSKQYGSEIIPGVSNHLIWGQSSNSTIGKAQFQ